MTGSTNTSNATHSTTIYDKIQTACGLFDRWSGALRENPSVQTLLNRLQREIAASAEAMIETGIVASCRQCEEEEGGSCCGAGIENKYTPVLLLINLLMGRTLPEARRAENSCFFLGERGCRLQARHTLCINYLCLNVQKSIPPAELIRLQNIIGAEMDTLFLVHETIKKIVQA